MRECNISQQRSRRRGRVLGGRAQQSIEKGKIINLMSADIENVNLFIHPALGGLLVLPLTIIVCIVLLYQQISCALPSCPCFCMRLQPLSCRLLLAVLLAIACCEGWHLWLA